MAPASASHASAAGPSPAGSPSFAETGSDAPGAAPDGGAATLDRHRMGVRLRAIRKAQGATLKALSGRSGVALSTLSKMELGQISISYEKFAAVAQALDVDIVRLLDPAASAPPPVQAPVFAHARFDQARSHADGRCEYRVLAAEFPGRRMEPVHIRILARERDAAAEFARHAGHEFFVVLSGTVRLCFETGEEVRLRRGESVYFDSGIGHRYLSVGRADAQIVAVTTTGR